MQAWLYRYNIAKDDLEIYALQYLSKIPLALLSVIETREIRTQRAIYPRLHYAYLDRQANICASNSGVLK